MNPSLFRAPGAGRRWLRARCIPQLEVLEDRQLPSSLQFTAFGADSGTQPRVNIYSAGVGGAQITSFYPYAIGFLGGVRVAVGDVNNDGFDDIITAAGPGGGPHVEVFEGKGLTNGTFDPTKSLIASFFAYSPLFTGGAYVAAADVNNDGYADIIAGAGNGGGPHVQVFDGKALAVGTPPTVLASFFAYDPSFRGGVTVAGADINHDGFAEVITGAGPEPSQNVGPTVEVFDGATLVQNPVGSPAPAPLESFSAFAPNFTGGVFVAAGDLNNDGYADLIVGQGGGGGPTVEVYGGKSIAIGTFDPVASLLATFTVYPPAFSGGIRVAYDAVDKTIIVAGGPGQRPVAGYGFTVMPNPVPPTYVNIFGTFIGGMFISI
jgi:hypothetical protein